MRIFEFDTLDEATEDSVDLLRISKYVAEWLITNKPKRPVTLSDMSGALPQFYSGYMINLLFDQQLQFMLHKPEKGVVGWYDPRHNVVSLDKRLVYYKQELISVLTHEIQHALDDYKSEGRALRGQSADDSYRDYLRRPQEINARFAQALLDIVNGEMESLKTIGRVGTAQESKEVIRLALSNQKLGRGLFQEGPEGQRQYNRLFSRAYKFYDESKHLIDTMSTREEKQNFAGKVKSLIKKYLL